MKKNTHKIGLMVLVINFLVLTNASIAQVVSQSEFLQRMSNAEVKAQNDLSNIQAKVEYRIQHPTVADLAWESNALAHWKPLPAWPDSFNKQEVLKHCADVVRSAIDTNQIEIACANLTNRPDEAIKLREISSNFLSELNGMADLLTNSNLITYMGIGYEAELNTPTNHFGFIFWSNRQQVTAGRQFDMRTLDQKRVLTKIRFYENGKVMNMLTDIPCKMSLSFKEDGHLDHYYQMPNQARKP